jgi:hypothetical protein
VHIAITPGAHASEADINMQLNDKERVAAALENHTPLEVVNQCVVEPEMARAAEGPPRAATCTAPTIRRRG